MMVKNGFVGTFGSKLNIYYVGDNNEEFPKKRLVLMITALKLRRIWESFIIGLLFHTN